MTQVLVERSYDYYKFDEVLFAGTPKRVERWIKKHNSDNLIVVKEEDPLPKELTHYPSGHHLEGRERYELPQHWVIMSF